ncbi:MAG: ClpXP protease specificity-enhancing factor [Gammaproteobacteria bacterium]|nr:ClpXP protease specificity-enhancing factor SspB [Gammaproteobacteria bacterium]MXY57263.1 ClpXP protease specificity-enhancing factor [Gammaproteobacteria bacterium]MYK46319.1 ClpXP protease specificity-enhancing factor [Gammaproteobacteria bacterium]
MTSTRPYLVQAMIDWIVDNAWTPYVVIAADAPGTEALLDHATDGRLVLNVSATATRNLAIGKDTLEVDCRFGGRAVHVSAPIGTVVAVYARENHRGMVFEVEDNLTPAEPNKPSPPKLSLVK